MNTTHQFTSQNGAAAILLLLLLLGTHASAQEQLCEVIGAEGAVTTKPCCVVSADKSNKNYSSDQKDDCQAASEVLNTEVTRFLSKASDQHRVEGLAKFLRGNPDVTIDVFTIDPPPKQFQNMCCSCVPGENCSAETPSDVCGPATSGSCPAGDIRTVCTGNTCTGIDD